MRRKPESPCPDEAAPERAEHLRAGESAEDLALNHLRRRGLKLLTRNYRCRAGELDLVMRQDRKLIVVEIRYRRDPRFVTPLESVTVAKQRRIVRATQHFLRRHPWLADRELRFDVVALSGPLTQATLVWRRGAFDCTGFAAW